MKRIIAALVVLLSLTVMSVEYAQADQLFWTRELAPPNVFDGDPYDPHGTIQGRGESTIDTDDRIVDAREVDRYRLVILLERAMRSLAWIVR